MIDDTDVRSYRVVKNKEEEYSLWMEEKELPPGWVDAGRSGSRQECLVYIAEVWTDMRPLSLRKAMDAIE
jgi:MbtH protein